MENFYRNLELSFQNHHDLILQRKGQSLDDLGEIDCRIIKLEDYIRSELNRHPELYDEYDLSEFISE